MFRSMTGPCRWQRCTVWRRRRQWGGCERHLPINQRPPARNGSSCLLSKLKAGVTSPPPPAAASRQQQPQAQPHRQRSPPLAIAAGKRHPPVYASSRAPTPATPTKTAVSTPAVTRGQRPPASATPPPDSSQHNTGGRPTATPAAIATTPRAVGLRRPRRQALASHQHRQPPEGEAGGQRQPPRQCPQSPAVNANAERRPHAKQRPHADNASSRLPTPATPNATPTPTPTATHSQRPHRAAPPNRCQWPPSAYAGGKHEAAANASGLRAEKPAASVTRTPPPAAARGKGLRQKGTAANASSRPRPTTAAITTSQPTHSAAYRLRRRRASSPHTNASSSPPPKTDGKRPLPR